MSHKLTISEIFGRTIQGEGALIGRPTVFVRTGGCDSRCSWCDTLYAVLPEYKNEWKTMSTEEVFAEIQWLSPTPILVTLSGGNPAIQPLGDLIDLGHEHGYTFGMETQATIARSWMRRLDYLTRLTWLIGKVRADHWHDVTVLPQLHTLLWQNRRGV